MKFLLSFLGESWKPGVGSGKFEVPFAKLLFQTSSFLLSVLRILSPASHLLTSVFRLPTSYFLLPTSNFQLPTPPLLV